MSDDLVAVDPFDLPEWLGVADVTWSALAGIVGRYVVPGELAAPGQTTVACDLLAVDQAYPTTVAPDDVRLRAHQAWRNGEVHLVRRDGRVALAVPGTEFTADLVLDAIGRLARAVGAPGDRYAVLIRIGTSSRRTGS